MAVGDAGPPGSTGVITLVESSAAEDTDLSLSQPPDINTDAAGPSGATPTYSLPTVRDPDDTTLPTPTCTPASGSIFAIGTTTVDCSVSDPDDTPSTASATFTVTVHGARSQLDRLLNEVEAVGPGSSLADKVRIMRSELGSEHPDATCATLNAFVDEVQAQTGKTIPAGLAAGLIASALQIEAVLAC
jgi:hypothetical protein